MSSTTPVSTSQTAQGRTLVRLIDNQYYLMIWSGGLSGQIHAAAGESIYANTFFTFAGASSLHGTGPAFVPLPQLTGGTLVWVDSKGNITFGTATSGEANWFEQWAQGGDPHKWTVGSGTSITKSSATGSPTACQMIQNGVLVLTILWQDSGAKSMVYAQIDPGNVTKTLAFDSFGIACLDSPWITHHGGTAFLAYASSDGAVNLAVDTEGGVNFAFSSQFTQQNAGATYGPAFVPLNRTQGYLFWPTNSGIAYAQLGLAITGNWVANSDSDTFGLIDSVVPFGPISAEITRSTVDGVWQDVILLAVAGKISNPPGSAVPTTGSNYSIVVNFTPDRSPILLTQAQSVVA